jgi:hypothetical protein
MRKLTLLVGATALAATLAACGGGSAKPSRADSTSPTSAAPAPDAVGSVPAAQFVALATKATEHAQTVRLRESMSLLGAHVTASGVMRFGQKSTASVTASTPVGPVQVVVSGGDVYIKGLGMGEPGKPWTKNPGAAQQLAAALQQADPRQALQILSGVGALHRVGNDRVNGVLATHYTVTVDLAKAAQRNAQVARVLDELIKQGVRAEATQVWVDSAQRPVRIATSVQVPDPTAKTRSSTSAQQVDFTDWGKPVTITVPPASQVSGR